MFAEHGERLLALLVDDDRVVVLETMLEDRGEKEGNYRNSPQLHRR